MTDPTVDLTSTSLLPLTETGGARIGWNFWLARNWTYPLATLTVSNKGIDISTRWVVRNYHLEIADIQTVTQSRGFMSKGIRFVSSAPGSPSFLVFWTLSAAQFDRIKSALTDAGVGVTSLQ